MGLLMGTGKILFVYLSPYEAKMSGNLLSFFSLPVSWQGLQIGSSDQSRTFCCAGPISAEGKACTTKKAAAMLSHF